MIDYALALKRRRREKRTEIEKTLAVFWNLFAYFAYFKDRTCVLIL